MGSYGDLRMDDSMGYPVEHIEITVGWLELERGYFCKIKKANICVEDFGSTRRQALRRARRAWRDEHQEQTRYPRRFDCEG